MTYFNDFGATGSTSLDLFDSVHLVYCSERAFTRRRPTMKSDCVAKAQRPQQCLMWPSRSLCCILYIKATLFEPVVLPFTPSAPIDNLMEIATKIELYSGRARTRQLDHWRRFWCDMQAMYSQNLSPVFTRSQCGRLYTGKWLFSGAHSQPLSPP